MCVFFNYMLVTSLLICPVFVFSLHNLEPPVYQASLGQFPYQVDFKSQSRNYSVLCAGALIGTNKVLTLASCLIIGGIGDSKEDGNDTRRIIDVASTYVVAATLRRVETFKQNRDSQWRRIASILLSKDMLLAITFTRKRFVLNDYVDTIPYASERLKGNEHCVLAGYAVRVGDGKSDNLTYGYFNVIPEGEFTVVDLDSEKTMYAKDELGARGYPGSALVCFNTTDPNEGERGLMTGISMGNEFSTGASSYIRLSYYHDFVKNTSTNIKEIVYKYCLLVTLCKNFLMTEF